MMILVLLCMLVILAVMLSMKIYHKNAIIKQLKMKEQLLKEIIEVARSADTFRKNK